jgi:hypothetical protein
MIFLYE